MPRDAALVRRISARDIRVGDAGETLRGVGGLIDFVLLDGAFSLYLPVLKLLESWTCAGVGCCRCVTAPSSWPKFIG